MDKITECGTMVGEVEKIVDDYLDNTTEPADRINFFIYTKYGLTKMTISLEV